MKANLKPILRIIAEDLFLLAVIILVLVIAYVIGHAVVQWIPTFETNHPPVVPGTIISYETFEVEGMTCMRFGRAAPNGVVWNFDGVACDWSQWDGRQK